MMTAGPMIFLRRIVGRVRGQVELGGAALAGMTSGAAELLGGVLAFAGHKEIKPGMGGELVDP